MNTSLCTRGADGGSGLPSSAISVNPLARTVLPVVEAEGPIVCAPTIEGRCIRRPALTRRTSTLPVAVAVAGVAEIAADALNSDAAALVLSNATPLIR